MSSSIADKAPFAEPLLHSTAHQALIVEHYGITYPSYLSLNGNRWDLMGNKLEIHRIYVR